MIQSSQGADYERLGRRAAFIAEDRWAPHELRTAFDAAQAGYFTGPFAELYARLLNTLSNNRTPEISLAAWREKTEAPQRSVGGVSLVAMDLITRHAEDTAAASRVEATGLAATLCVTLAIAAVGLGVVLVYRVAQPIVAMTRRHAAARGK